MGGTTMSQVPNLMSGTAPTLPGGGQFPMGGGANPGMGIGMDYRSLIGGQSPEAIQDGPSVGAGPGVNPGDFGQIGYEGMTPSQQDNQFLVGAGPGVNPGDFGQIGYEGINPPPLVSPMPMPGGPQPGMGVGMDYRSLIGSQPDLPRLGVLTPEEALRDSMMPGPTGPSGNPSGPNPQPGDGMYPNAPPPQSNSLFANQQKPITQGTGQLPPGFGALSPIDRSQISPNASIGMTGGVKGRDMSGPPSNITTINSANRLQPTNGMRPGGAPAPKLNATNPARNAFAPGMPGMPPGGGGRVAQGPRMNDQTMFNQSAAARAGSQFGNNLGQTAYGNAPANRYAPPNAPGVRSKPITRPRIR